MENDEITESNRKRPNILVTGTPGVGKTVTASLLTVCIQYDRCRCRRRRLFYVAVHSYIGSFPNTIMDNQQEKLGLKHINVGAIIAEHKLYEGRDNELDTHILDEDKLLDLMETMLEEAAEEGLGVVADFHSCELFPERWFDLVLVLRASTEVLFDRLTKRRYNDKKRDENMESEIMQVILDEAKESYDPEIVHEVPSNTLEEMESNVQRVKQWMDQWMADHACESE